MLAQQTGPLYRQQSTARTRSRQRSILARRTHAPYARRRAHARSTTVETAPMYYKEDGDDEAPMSSSTAAAAAAAAAFQQAPKVFDVTPDLSLLWQRKSRQSYPYVIGIVSPDIGNFVIVSISRRRLHQRLQYDTMCRSKLLKADRQLAFRTKSPSRASSY
jgi:hypothetical protein